MKGIQYMTDDSGDRTSVVIDLKKHGDLWEDFYDNMIAAQRKSQPRESLKAVRSKLIQKGKLCD
ncbi:MAG: hypothetical protein HQK92_04390 [Nitrospirae bacterium]|nr:hypothetical protein [Nitrospirota bacterium]